MCRKVLVSGSQSKRNELFLYGVAISFSFGVYFPSFINVVDKGARPWCGRQSFVEQRGSSLSLITTRNVPGPLFPDEPTKRDMLRCYLQFIFPFVPHRRAVLELHICCNMEPPFVVCSTSPRPFPAAWCFVLQITHNHK